MKIVMLYRPNSEHERLVLDYVRDYRIFKGSEGNIELMSLDTREGAAMASLYDVLMYPAVLALANDGQLMKLWADGSMPLLNEIDQYLSRQAYKVEKEPFF